MRIAIGSDHAGFALKQATLTQLKDAGHDVKDLGPSSNDRVDYPDFAHEVAKLVANGEVDRGVLVCGSGIGMAIAANRHPGVRAVNCTLVWQAEMCRRHNDANLLCLGERVLGPGLAASIVDTFLATDFEGGRHEARVEKIELPTD
jgi:ribose 5-phosphate isomerase B